MTHRVEQDDLNAVSAVLAPWLCGSDVEVRSKVDVSAGQQLHLDSEFSDTSLYVISSGLCFSEWQPSPARRRLLELFCPNDIIQPKALPKLPGLRIVSVTDSQVLCFKLAGLENESRQDSSLVAILVDEFGKTTRRKTNLISSLGGLCAEARVAALFIELSLRLTEQTSDRSGFQMPLSRQDIADHLALNADTLSRIITRFKADGIFHQVGRDKIYIKNWEALLKQCPISGSLLADYQS